MGDQRTKYSLRGVWVCVCVCGSLAGLLGISGDLDTSSLGSTAGEC